jgi:prevent-host-death family protein
MHIQTSTEARKRFFSLIKETVESNDPVLITGKSGDVVLMSKEDYDAIVETLYLHSVPGLVASIRSCDTKNSNEWIKEDDMKW